MAKTTWGSELAGEISAVVNKRGYCPHAPHPQQQVFLSVEDLEAFYGGAAGGGKSDAGLMGALQYVEVSNYSALILRRTYADLALPGAVMDRAESWLINTDAKWNGTEKTWTFPSGAKLTFGYLEHEKDKYRYQSAEFQYIFFDELTQFTQTQYTYMFSRLRRLAGSTVPLRMRSASNPGGEGHEWVKERFVDGDKTFVPAKLEDNPSLDAEEYEKSLEELDPVTKAQLLAGDWRVLPAGLVFQEPWFRTVESIPPLARFTRYFDLATSIKKRADYTASALTGFRPTGPLVVADVTNWKREWPETRDGILDDYGNLVDGGEGIVQIVKRDLELMNFLQKEFKLEKRPYYHVGVESQGMQLALTQDLFRHPVFHGVSYYARQAKGDKLEAARVWQSRARMFGVELVIGKWNRPFKDQAVSFDGEGILKDDMVDAVSGGVNLSYDIAGKMADDEVKPIVARSEEHWKRVVKSLQGS